MKVLVACEESQVVCKAFRARGHEAYSNDIIAPSGGKSEWHIKGDANAIACSVNWDLMIAFPPCTYVCFAGIRWNVNNPARQLKTAESIMFFKMLWEANIPKIAIENPVGVIPRHTGINWSQMIHPWQFGHEEEKKTCLWLKNLPPLVPTQIMNKREQRIFNMAPSPTRSKDRSKTYEGIAKAMAEQWG